VASKAINVRVPEEQLRLIDRAAKARGQNRSEFLLESCYEAAIATMSERLKVLMAQKAPRD
jgi:uncharacterized protein (DUF1778 family)